MTTVSQRLNKTFWIMLTAIFAVSAITTSPLAYAQNGSTSSQDDLEESARASWQPVRDLSRRTPKVRPSSAQVQLVDYETPVATASKTSSAKRVRPTSGNWNQGNTQRQAPARTNVRPASATVLAQPVMQHTGMQHTVPLDGHVTFEPMHDSGCDAMPMGNCGCNDMGCDGGCGGSCGVGMGGCDGIGCSSGSCCNGDPMCGEYRDCDSLRPCLTLCWPQDGWFSAEYLMWWQDGVDLPPLASTGRLSDRDPLANGTILYGNDTVLEDNLDGYRFDGGFWFDNCHTWGIGAGFFQLDRSYDRFSGGNDNSTLVRPIITVLEDDNAGSLDDLTEGVALVNDPTREHVGDLNITVDSQLSGWDLYLRHFTKANSGCTGVGPCCCPTPWCSRSEHRIGFRQVELDEGIGINSSVLVGSSLSFALDESFRTNNQFNGIDVGWYHTRTMNYWSFDLGLRIAAGNTRQRVRIDGSTVVNQTAPAVQGGLLALNSNIGTYERDEFSVLPELNMKLGYQLTDQLKATFGYTFLYWSNVVRPGDQIERIIDQDQVPNSNADTPTGVFPRFAFDNTDYWAQGLNFGLDYRW